MPLNNSTMIVIPARYKSSRFPGKPLVDLAGKPMIVRVAERCMEVLPRDRVFVATDDESIKQTCDDQNINVIMTSEYHKTGTDRIAEAAQQIETDFIINVQGDEPLIHPSDIEAVIREKQKYPNDIINAYCRISADEDPDSNTLPKVVFDEAENLVYMSRAKIPGFKEGALEPDYFKQVCIYGFTKEQLRLFHQFGRKSNLEAYEDIEILRFIDLKINVRMIEVSNASIAVDTPEDVARVLAVLGEMR